MNRMILATALLLLCASCGGSGGVPQQQELEPAVQSSLSGNASLPQLASLGADVRRELSNDSVLLQGHEWHDRSSNTEEVGSTLELNGPDLAWGIYALGGFGQVTPGSVYASFFTEADQPCRIYLAVADFDSGHWRFVDAGKDDFSYIFPDGGRYYSDSGVCYLAVLRHGEGDAKLYSLTFGRLGDTDLPAPAGLQADASPGLVSLSWLPVTGASGYNVYRAYDKKFVDQIRLNDEPVSEPAFDDDFLINGEMYFYRVTAVGAIESEYSNYLSVYVPASTLPAPQNLRVIDTGDDFIEFAWDWEGTSPSGWAVFLAHGKDFNLEAPTEKRTIGNGGTRKFKYTMLDPGRLYFIRMAAKDSNGALGAMTDALACLTGEQWEWFEVEEIDNGTEPVRAVIAEDRICCAYVNDNQINIALNGGQGQPWTIEGTPLDTSLTFLDEYHGEEKPCGGFMGELDIDYRNGNYLISSLTRAGNDLYAAMGGPGDGWTVERVDTGYYPGGFKVGSAGVNGAAAITDNGYVVSGQDYWLEQYCLYNRPFGSNKSWTKKEIRSQPQQLPTEFDMEVLNGKMFASCYDFNIGQLLLYSEEDDDFTQLTDNPPNVAFGIYTDLERVGDKWMSCGYHGVEEALYLLQDNGTTPWDSELIYKQDGYRTGRNVRMEPFRQGVVCIYMGDRTRDWYCSVLHGNGEWETQLMKIGEIDPFEKADLAVLNDQPVFVVADRITGRVYAVRGNIPQE